MDFIIWFKWYINAGDCKENRSFLNDFTHSLIIQWGRPTTDWLPGDP